MYRNACIGIASVLVSMTIAGEAHAQTPPTVASCMASAVYRDGREVIPTNLQIGSEILLNGIAYRVYEGMTVESMCETHVPWMVRLANKQAEAQRATAEVARVREEGRKNAGLVKLYQSDTVRMYPYEMIAITALVSPFAMYLLLWFLKSIWKAIARHFSRRRKYSSGKFAGFH
jgi:hypothetical protein